MVFAFLSLQTVCSLPSEQAIHTAVVCSSAVWVAVHRSSLLHLIHAPSGVFLATVECTRPVMEVLKRECTHDHTHTHTHLIPTLSLFPSVVTITVTWQCEWGGCDSIFYLSYMHADSSHYTTRWEVPQSWIAGHIHALIVASFTAAEGGQTS